MLGHLSLGCSNLASATLFYDAALAPLGYARVCQGRTYSGYGYPGQTHDKFAVKQQTGVVPPGPGFHVAFTAPTRAAVDLFYQAAIKNGGTSNGAPGLRPHYGPKYYAAFVIDLDGHPLEAVCQDSA